MYERTWVVGIPQNGSPAVVNLSTSLPGGTRKFVISAWKAAFGGGSSSPPVLILEGERSINDVTSIAGPSIASGLIPEAILAVPSLGVAEAPFNAGGTITVAWVSTAGGANAADIVQVKIREVR